MPIHEINPLLIVTQEDLEKAVADLWDQDRIAVDTESDSFYSYAGKLCLVQFSTRDRDYIVDAVAIQDLKPLEKVLAHPKIEKVLHAAEQDIREIKTACPMAVENVFDTMVAARILGWNRYGLATLLEDHFSIKLDKRYQRSDWGSRPLSTEQLEYAARDTHYLLRLRELLFKELRKQGLWAEAREEFERAARVEPIPRPFDPEGFRFLKGAKELDPQRLAILRELYLLRDELSRAMDRPPFKVMPDGLLVRLAKDPPKQWDDLRKVAGMTPYLLRRFGKKALKAVQAGRQASPIKPLRRSRPGALSRAESKRFEILRDWRKTRARERGVESDVVVGNETLKEIARRRPQTLDDLREIPGMGPNKLARYGEDLLKVLRPPAEK